MNRDACTAIEEISLLRLPAVKARTGLSRSEIYRRVSSGKFPAPIKLGTRVTAWSSQAIGTWIAGYMRVDAGVQE